MFLSELFHGKNVGRSFCFTSLGMLSIFTEGSILIFLFEINLKVLVTLKNPAGLGWLRHV